MAPASSRGPSKSSKKRAHFTTVSENSSPQLPSQPFSPHRSSLRRSPPQAATSSAQGNQPKASSQTQEPSKPNVPPYNAPTSIPTAGQQIFVHHSGIPPLHSNPFPVGPATFQNHAFPAPGYFQSTVPVQQIFPPTAATAPTNMAGYGQPTPLRGGFNFQPQVPDTSNGPFVHRYYPRHDGGMPQPYPPHAGMGGPVPAPAAYAPAPATAAFNPVFMQQPFQQPAMMPGGVPAAGGHVAGQPLMAHHPPPQVVAGNAPPQQVPMHFDPVLGIGRTTAEIAAEQRQFAEANGLFEPQDFKPTDDDPARFYMVREVDGTWTQRNRYTIDALGCRWYLADEGYFYAVRLPD